MTTNRSFGQDLSGWLHDDAASRVPDHLSEVLVRTAATRQRPWWSSPERWLPMTETTFSGRLAPPRPVLALLLVAALIAALVGLAVFVGTNRQQPPIIHSGLAGSGRIVAVDDSGALMSYAADGSDPRQLATLPEGTPGLSISPDGTRIAYRRMSPPVGYEIRGLADDAVVDVRPPASDVQDEGPGWSPDGRFIAFVGDSAGADRLYVAAADGSKVEDLTPSTVSSTDRIWRPTFSPDGTLIAFAVAPAGNTDSGHLVVMRNDGSGVRTLSTRPVSAGDAGGPAWAPDPAHQLIAYESLLGTMLMTRVFDVAAGVDHGAGQGFWPSWSPDGTRIATCCVLVTETAGILADHPSQVQRFTPFYNLCNEYRGSVGATVCSRAIWSPDGTRLMAVDIAGGGLLITRADGSGAEPTRIPLGIGLDRPIGPYVWQPIWP